MPSIAGSKPKFLQCCHSVKSVFPKTFSEYRLRNIVIQGKYCENSSSPPDSLPLSDHPAAPYPAVCPCCRSRAERRADPTGGRHRRSESPLHCLASAKASTPARRPWAPSPPLFSPCGVGLTTMSTEPLCFLLQSRTALQ